MIVILRPRDGRHPIDACIDRTLAEQDLDPAPPAERLTLIRRATFDLTGLPPTPEEVCDFLSDERSEEAAFAAVVERLLASPHYGEQMARHWLDVTRYADSSGYANDYERGNAWRYRDYVVRAFNDDKTYDEFVREQIAGDEIDPEDPEKLIAVGFLRMGPWELTGMEVAQVARQRFLDDAVDSIGQVFLGHMLQCARCHDHKFDPVPTRDYYAMQAVLATTQLAERRAEFLPAENRAGFDERRYLDVERRHYQAVLDEVDAKRTLDAAREWLAENELDPAPFEQAVREVEADGDGEAALEQVRRKMTADGVHPDLIPPRHVGFEPRDFGMERIGRKGLERLRWREERYQPFALSVYSGRTPSMKSVYAPLRVPDERLTAGELEQTSILAGGDPFSPTKPVSPDVLSAAQAFSRKTDDGLEATIPDEIEGRRLALANWIVDARNPLTARVMVNRVWQWHFGRAIAANPNNFGATGGKPTHPELLDHLAARFIADGWSIKSLHRFIMSSTAYRRASIVGGSYDADVTEDAAAWYAGFAPRRLAAEEVRDAALAVSGELNRTLGGVPVRPEMNLEAAMQPRMVMGTFAEAWQPSPSPSDRHRRSLYALKLRGLRDPIAEALGSPNPDVSCEVREVATTAPQVFAMFNSEIAYHRAVATAQRLLDETSDRRAAIERLFILAFSRSPTDNEFQDCLAHWEAMEVRHRTLNFAKPDYPTEIVREAVEENTGVKFTYVEPLYQYVDFQPDAKFADVDETTRGLAEVCLVVLNANEFVYVY